jgi:chromosome partitioning protein
MKIIAVLSQKGGAGKTSLSIHLAIAAEQAGKKILIVDRDPQSAVTKWARMRAADSPAVVTSISPDTHRIVRDAQREGYDWLILDTAPRLDAVTVEVCRKADLVLVPTKPAFMDLLSTKETLELIKKAQCSGHVAIVLNAVPTNTSEGTEAREALAKLGQVLDAELHERVDFRRAITAGHGITEHLPKSRAASEIMKLYQEIERHLNG